MISLFKNLNTKILALVSALLLWLFVVGFQSNIYELSEQVDVKFQNLPSGFSISSEIQKVKVKVRASADYAKAITPQEVELYIDAKDFKPGLNAGKIVAYSKNPQLSVVDVNPADVSVNLEFIETREFPVEAVVVGNPAYGFSVEETKLSVATVKVTGASSILDKIKKLRAQAMLNGFESASIVRNAKVEVDDSLKGLAGGLTIAPDVVEARLKITANKPVKNDTSSNGGETATNESSTEKVTKSYKIKLQFRESADNEKEYEITPSEVELRLTYPRFLEKDASQIVGRLYVEKIRSGGDYTLTNSDFNAPAGVVIESISPKYIKINLK